MSRARTLRRVPHVRRQEDDLSGADSDVHGGLARLLHDAKHHVALYLVEELLGGVVVVVGALVRAADDHGDELAVFPDLAVSHGRLQELPVLFDEGTKVDGSQASLGGHVYSFTQMLFSSE
jgi:hypothetical protein